MNAASRPTTIRVLGSSLVANPHTPQFRPYTYGGDRPYVPPKNPAPERVCAVDDCQGVVHGRGLCKAHLEKDRRGLPLETDNRRRTFDPSFCGTTKGYGRHMKYKVPLCQPCRDAKNGYDRARYAGDTVRMKEYTDAGNGAR